MSRNILFINEDTLKNRSGMSVAIDFKQVKPFIKVAQDAYILPVLGSGLYDRLQEGVEDSNLNVPEKDLLNDYITDCLVWYTISLLPFGLGYQIFSKGFLQKTSEESVTPSRADLELISKNYKSYAEMYSERMIKYLRANYTLYPLHLNPGTGCDVIFPTSNAFTSPIFLGNSRKRRRDEQGSSTPNTPTLLSSEYTATGGETTFEVSALDGKTLRMATRSGLVKGITTSATADTAYLQIVGTTVTLPTGDIAVEGELFTFLYI